MPIQANRKVNPGRVVRKCHPLWSLLPICLLALMSAQAWAIPPNTEITNVAEAAYSVDGVNFLVSASDTVFTDAASGNSPPFRVDLAPPSVEENSVGALVGLLAAGDPDPTDGHVFAVSDPRFVVVGAELRLAPNVSFDFETEASVDIIVSATDPLGAVVEQPITVTIIDVNEAPTAIGIDNQSAIADVAGAIVGLLSTADPDVGDTHTYRVDDPRFEVVDGQLKLVDTESLGLGEQVDVTVTSTDSGGLEIMRTFSVAGTADGETNATIEFERYAPGASSKVVFDVEISQCAIAGDFQPLNSIAHFDGSAIGVPGEVPLAEVDIFTGGDALFFQVVDSDANESTVQRDRIQVELTTDTGDHELIELQETGFDTDTFVGYIQSARAPVNPSDCLVDVDVNVELTATYRRPSAVLGGFAIAQPKGGPAVVTTTALVDPLGRVFDAASGRAIDGAVITLVEAVGGLAAQIFSDDGATTFPATVTSGGSAVDGAGQSHDFASGGYRYPSVPAGNYQLTVVPPNRFSFPSVVADAALSILPGAPFALSSASRGQPFVVPVGPAIRVDIPLDLKPLAPTVASGDLLTLSVGNPLAIPTQVGATQCVVDGAVQAASTPTMWDGTAINVPATLDLASARLFTRNESVFVTITDGDQDLDPFAPDWIDVQVTSVSGDAEVIRLVETGASTGIFSGYLQTGTGSPTNQDCRLDADAGTEFTVNYVDPDDAQDLVAITGALDVGFVLFNSASGEPVDGVEVTLIDVATGNAADGAVFGPGGFAAYPATVVTGASATDGANRVIDFAAGSFQFPVIVPGSYRLEVRPGNTFVFPSTRSDEDLNTLPGGPYTLVGASRGETFEVAAGEVVGFDLPIDPAIADIVVNKEASKQAVAIGDFLQYRVSVQNNSSSAPASDLVIRDLLPSGFRYVPGSARLDDEPALDPTIGADGRSFAFSHPELLAGETIVLKYVTEATAGTKTGIARNAVVVTGVGIEDSNTAFADVVVREDLLASHAIIAGRVIDGECGSEESLDGLANVRILLEDGTYVITDAEGDYHIEGVTPGTHVVQVDLGSLPETHEIAACEANTRFSGNDYSQFVEVQAGTLWRANFTARLKPPITEEVRAKLTSVTNADYIDFVLELVAGDIPLKNPTAIAMLPEGLSYVAGSSKLNGQAIDEPEGATSLALTYRLDDVRGATKQLAFRAKISSLEQAEVLTKAMLMFETDAGRQRTPVIENRLVRASAEVVETVGAKTQTAPGPVSAASADSVFGAVSVPETAAPESRVVNVFGTANQSADSGYVVVEVTQERDARARTGVEIPEVDDGHAPEFDLNWLKNQSADHEVVWPKLRHNPRSPSIEVAAKHSPNQRVELLVNGRLVNPLTFEGVIKDSDRELALTMWDNITIRPGDNSIEVQVQDADGDVVERLQRGVHFSGAPIRAELVPELSFLKADGITPPVLAIRLWDRDGFHARPGTTGAFGVLAPYVAFDDAKHLIAFEDSTQQSAQRYLVRKDGVAYLQLEPTNESGEVDIRFDFDEHRVQDIRARLEPGSRDWVVVGLGVSTLR